MVTLELFRFDLDLILERKGHVLGRNLLPIVAMEIAQASNWLTGGSLSPYGDTSLSKVPNMKKARLE